MEAKRLEVISLVEFASEERIIGLVAKERGKYANKDGGSKGDGMRNRVLGMTPPHKYWKNPGKGRLPKKADHGLERWTYRKKSASIRVKRSIMRYRASILEHPEKQPVEWYVKLKKFIEEIQERLSKGELTLETPDIKAKLKDKEEDGKVWVFRPICLYKDLETKIIQALTYKYILYYFDRFFHPNMLFMRATRQVADGEYIMPKYLDAIDMVTDYREKYSGAKLYVGECDIQKFYDIFNHDTVLECFEDLFGAAKNCKELDVKDDSVFDPLRRVIRAYLKSYDFSGKVLKWNDDVGFWKGNKVPGTAKGMFKWVKEKDFMECYSPEEFAQARDTGKLGIPQGGALSGIIVNVIMRKVDEPLVARKDDRLLFVRYCDDILLMHTDRDICRSYLDTYYNQLIRYKLVPHPAKDVSSFKKENDGSKTTKGFWKAKTKNVYLWGRGEKDSSDWVAFVGYEMRSTGEIRIRKDKIDGEYKKIARSYHKVVDAKAVTEARENKTVLTEEQQIKLMERMANLPERLKDYEKAGANKYTFSQARRLDKYLYLKRMQAAKIIGCANPSSIVGSFRTYSEVVEEKEN